MAQAPQLALTATDDGIQPPDDILRKFDVDNDDFADFAICMRIIAMQMQNTTLNDACKAVGVPVRTLYSGRWQELMAKARRVHAGPLLSSTLTMANYVYKEWPKIVESLVNVAKNGRKDHEKVQAAELLYQIYIMPIAQAPQDDSAERAYVNKPKNFNPMMPIQVNEGGTVIINQGNEKTSTDISATPVYDVDADMVSDTEDNDPAD